MFKFNDEANENVISLFLNILIETNPGHLQEIFNDIKI